MAEFKNPNQQGAGDNRSLLVMMFVMVTIFFATQYFRTKHNPQTALPNSKPAQTAPAQAGTTAPAASAAPAEATPAVAATAETTTTIENELYRVTFSNRGAQVKSWILKKFTDSDGKPLDIVHGTAAAQFGHPLSLYTYDAGLTKSVNEALYVGSASGNLTAPATLAFHYSDGGVEVEKTFSFDETYVLHADVQVKKNGVPVRALLSWPGGFGDQDNRNAYLNGQFDSILNGSDEHLAAKKVSGGNTINGTIDWAGVSDMFFAAIFLPDSPDRATVATFNNQMDVAKTIRRTGLGSGAPSKGSLDVPILGAALGDVSGHTQTRIFVGPKYISVLKSIHAANPKLTLEPLLNFGFWGAIAKYLFLTLQFIHSHISPNWGWAIVILTVLINLLLLPFRIMTMKNSLKMQRIQPQVEAVKKKYEKLKITDPKRSELNIEISKLYKDNNVNMFGGCLPTLVTLPPLWAFFTMLPRVVELRHAHWLWVSDLQAPDPYYILPILMVLSSFLLQFFTPSPGVDQQQQRMMAFMTPAITGYFVLTYGAGLGLYWAVGNLINIASQSVMNRTSLGQEMREIAAKRARRKAGAGATIQGKR